jgi:hypothetical protein
MRLLPIRLLDLYRCRAFTARLIEGYTQQGEGTTLHLRFAALQIRFDNTVWCIDMCAKFDDEKISLSSTNFMFFSSKSGLRLKRQSAPHPWILWSAS